MGRNASSARAVHGRGSHLVARCRAQPDLGDDPDLGDVGDSFVGAVAQPVTGPLGSLLADWALHRMAERSELRCPRSAVGWLWMDKWNDSGLDHDCSSHIIGFCRTIAPSKCADLRVRRDLGSCGDRGPE